MSIWRYFRSTYPDYFYMQDCQKWFKHHSTIETGTMFIVTCFEIRRNRNKEIFQNVKKDHWASVNSIFFYHSSMVVVLGRTSKHHVVRHVCWYPPPEGYIKVNVDDSYFGNPANAGFGGLLRNDRGVWIHGLPKSCDRASNLLAEL
ncbi:hypothetical protein MTR_4g073630 [Medicago truncatula]|uniref:Uncharacterized protein n=1 Tax=Medicago truncatula TaxID=3880 RepID=A0A072UN87_MEDTR|nr:hypothetical protein MTR_4g073630 [Medicago truncatula]